MKKKEIIMAKKYDYQLKILTPSEAMEIMGFTNSENFVSAISRHLPSRKSQDNEEMFSISDIKSMAKSMDKEISIPEEIKDRCIVYEQEIPTKSKEEEPIKRRLEHPYMEGVKCLENCFHKDDYGICKCGSRCEVYDVQIAPEEDTATKINRSIEVKRANEFQRKREAAQNVYNDGSAKISAVQDILMKQLYAMTAPDLTQDERESAIKTGIAVSNVSKTVLTSFSLQMHSFELATMYGIDKNGVKKLI